MAHIYVIMRTAWEYDDECYYTGDGDPGFAQCGFRTPAAAAARCAELERQAWREEILDAGSDSDLSDYIAPGSNAMGYTHLEAAEFVATLAAAGLQYDPEANEFAFPGRPFADWEVDQIAGALSTLYFYKVEAIEWEE